MITLSAIYKAEPLHKDISIAWVAEDGRIIRVPHCIISSFHGEGDTMNIFIPVSQQVRTVNRNTIIEFNGEEVVL